MPSDPFSILPHPSLCPGRLSSLESLTWAPLLSGFKWLSHWEAPAGDWRVEGERSPTPPHLALFLAAVVPSCNYSSPQAVPLPQLQFSACFQRHTPAPFQALGWYCFPLPSPVVVASATTLLDPALAPLLQNFFENPFVGTPFLHRTLTITGYCHISLPASAASGLAVPFIQHSSRESQMLLS